MHRTYPFYIPNAIKLHTRTLTLFISPHKVFSNFNYSTIAYLIKFFIIHLNIMPFFLNDNADCMLHIYNRISIY